MPKATVAVTKEYKITFIARSAQQKQLEGALRMILLAWKQSNTIMKLDIFLVKTLEELFTELDNPKKIHVVKRK